VCLWGEAERESEWRWDVFRQQTQGFTHPNRPWQHADCRCYFEHDWDRRERNISDGRDFKDWPSRCNLPLPTGRTCDGESYAARALTNP
jgi:hypothetical protein